MYDNILHKPLVMRPGASSAAWSILQALLEKDGTHRLGSRDDFVSGNIHCHCHGCTAFVIILCIYIMSIHFPNSSVKEILKWDTQEKFHDFGSLWWPILVRQLTTFLIWSTEDVFNKKHSWDYCKFDICFLNFQNEIKAHTFFASINWDDLEQKKIPPPFTPNVVKISYL